MEKMKTNFPKAHAWLEEMAPNTWVTTFSDEAMSLNNVTRG